jgi:hypothetical protein
LFEPVKGDFHFSNFLRQSLHELSSIQSIKETLCKFSF